MGCTSLLSAVYVYIVSHSFSIRHFANWQCQFDIQTPSKSNSIDWWENVTRPKSTMGMTKTRLFWEQPQKGTKDICEQGQWQSHNIYKRHVVIVSQLHWYFWQLRTSNPGNWEWHWTALANHYANNSNQYECQSTEQILNTNCNCKKSKSLLITKPHTKQRSWWVHLDIGTHCP